MAFEDIGKEVGMNMDAYRGNPGALEQQVNKPAARKNSGLQAPLVKLLALQQLKQEQKTKEDQIKLQMMQQGQAPSVKDQVENDAIQRSVDETTKGIMGALAQKAAAQKKAQNKLLANATKFQQPTNPMAMMNRGIAGNRRNNMRSMAQGGIVGFNQGVYLPGDRRIQPKGPEFARKKFDRGLPTGKFEGSGDPFGRKGGIGFIKRLQEELAKTKDKLAANVPILQQNLGLDNIGVPPGESIASFDTAPENKIVTETSGNPPNFDTSNPNLLTSTKQPIKRPNIPPFVSDDGSGKPVNMPKSPTNVGPSMTSTPGGLQGLFDQRMKDAMADQYQGHEWMQPGRMMDFFRGLSTGNLTGAADAMRVGEEQAYNRAFKRASAGMDYATADAKIAAQVLAAKISAAARAASTNQLKKSDALRAYLELNKELNTLDSNLNMSLGEKISRLEKESQNPAQLRQDILTLKNGATGGRYSEIIEKMQIFLAQTGLPANSIPTNINPSLFDPNQQDKTVTPKTP